MNIFEPVDKQLFRERMNYLDRMDIESLAIRCCRHMLWCGYSPPGFDCVDVILQVKTSEQHIAVRERWSRDDLLRDDDATFERFARMRLRILERSIEMNWED